MKQETKRKVEKPCMEGELLTDRLVVADAINGFTYIGKVPGSRKTHSSIILNDYLMIPTNKLYLTQHGPNAISSFQRATLAYGGAIRDYGREGDLGIAYSSKVKLELENIVAVHTYDRKKTLKKKK